MKIEKAIEKESFSLVQLISSLYQELSLENVVILGSQHILPSTLEMFRVLFQKKLDPRNLFLIGKCYSSNFEIYLKMLKEGIYVHPSSVQFNSHESFDEAFCCHIQDFLQCCLLKIEERKPQKIIVLDDGGSLLSLLKEKEEFIRKYQVVGIEQTTSGYQKLKQNKLSFPIINVARSRTKLIYESPLVASVFVAKLLQKLSQKSLFPEQVLIIGKGYIGKAIFEELKKQSFYGKIYFYDNQESKSHFLSAILPQVLPNFDMIIGCTGESAMMPYSSVLKKDVILVSASSSDREFQAVNLRKKSVLSTNCHQDFFVEGVHLLNGGFPINFDENFDTVDPEEFQLTRALLLQGVFQAYQMSNSAKQSFRVLDVKIQEIIIENFLQMYFSVKEPQKNAVLS